MGVRIEKWLNKPNPKRVPALYTGLNPDGASAVWNLSCGTQRGRVAKNKLSRCWELMIYNPAPEPRETDWYKFKIPGSDAPRGWISGFCTRRDAVAFFASAENEQTRTLTAPDGSKWRAGDGGLAPLDLP